MIITYLSDTDELSLKSDEIDALITSIDYSSIIIKGTKTCGTELSQEYTTDELNTPTDDFKFTLDTENSRIIVKPIFFGLTSYTDGVYYLNVRLVKPDDAGYVEFSNCLFVDITYKCSVASLLKNIISENKNLQDNEKISTIIHILHYALVNGSNCGCNCTEMCTVFNELTSLLSNIDPQIQNDCGC
jgi:hypothetical protein